MLKEECACLSFWFQVNREEGEERTDNLKPVTSKKRRAKTQSKSERNVLGVFAFLFQSYLLLQVPFHIHRPKLLEMFGWRVGGKGTWRRYLSMADFRPQFQKRKEDMVSGRKLRTHRQRRNILVSISSHRPTDNLRNACERRKTRQMFLGDVNCGPRNHFLFPPFGSWALTYSSRISFPSLSQAHLP